jgi:cell shape-determining protein MreC
MPVLTSGGLLGRTFAAGLGAAKVRLITDTESRIAVRFGRFVQDAAGRVTFVELQTPEPLAQGLGRGVMSVRNLAAKDVAQAGISIGDWVVLADGSFPSNLQGFKVGQVTEIGARADGPLHADIRIAPAAKLAGLRQVMVMNRRE